MIFCRVLLLLLLASAGAWGQPQWRRQSTLPNLSSPLAMGMRILGNIRSGMTRTFQGIFGGGNQQGKEVNQGRPVRQQVLPPPEPAPVSPVHDIGFGTGTEAPSSFFTVVHELDSSTSFPDTRGFTDESFKPSEFFTGNNPFQGKIEEESLPFHQDVAGGVPQSGREQQRPSPVSVGNNHPGGFPSHSPTRTSFGLEDAKRESAIPFGNTNTFNLGKKQTQLPVAPAPHFPENTENREIEEQKPLPGQLLPYPLPHSILANRADIMKTKSPPLPKSQVPQTTQSDIPYQSAQKPIFSDKTETTSLASPVFVGQNKAYSPTPANRFQGNPKAPSFTEAREVKPQKELAGKPPVNGKPGGLINTGIKMRLAPTADDHDGEGAEVSSYEFGYGVLDRNTGNQFFHAEKREEGLTKGSYKIQLPDGRVQTVTYLADKQGFRPKITYEGKAKYPANREEKTDEA